MKWTFSPALNIINFKNKTSKDCLQKTKGHTELLINKGIEGQIPIARPSLLILANGKSIDERYRR